MKTTSTLYRGTMIFGEVVVTVDGNKLPLRLDLFNHSPTGFSYGYGGSGPAQLALAILADFLGDDARALVLYQPFKWKVIAQLKRDEPWTLTGAQVRDVIDVLEDEMKGRTR